LQRRCLRAARDLKRDTVISREDIEPLRPAPADSISPDHLPKVLGLKLRRDFQQGDYFKWAELA
jgi:sialic acid synthase SpsE